MIFCYNSLNRLRQELLQTLLHGCLQNLVSTAYWIESFSSSNAIGQRLASALQRVPVYQAEMENKRERKREEERQTEREQKQSCILIME